MSRLLDRLPALATTGVGSLPFERASDAACHVLRAYELPFCPQLPWLDGDMVTEWLGTDPGRCGWTPDRDRERPAAWHEFVARLTSRPPSHGLVKLQVTGPVTLAIALERGSDRPGSGAGVVSLAHDVATWLAANTAGQVRRLAQIGLDALVVVDEPGLARAGVTAADIPLWDALRAAAPAWGMHICGWVPWDLVDALDLDLLSVDVATCGLTPEARPVLGRMLRRGARIGWGVIDPVAPRPAATASGLALAGLSALTGPELPLDRVAHLSLLTPSCGTGRLSGEREQLVAASLDATANAARATLDGYFASSSAQSSTSWREL